MVYHTCSDCGEEHIGGNVKIMVFTSPKTQCPFCNTTDSFKVKPKYVIRQCSYCGFESTFKELDQIRKCNCCDHNEDF